MSLVAFNESADAEHEFSIPTRFRVSADGKEVSLQPEGFGGFPNILPFSWHRETFERTLRERSMLDGSIIEFGTAQGGSTRQLAKLAPTRQLFTFDAFLGVPRTLAQAIDNRSPSKDGKIVDFTRWPLLPEHWKQFYPNVTVYEGLFRDSFPTFTRQYPDARFVLAYVDCNLYTSTCEALELIRTRMVPGGIIIFDDYSGADQCDGARKAADEWFLQNREALHLVDKSDKEGEGLFLVG